MLEPILRLVVSLAVVIGLLLATMRVARRTMRSRPGSLVRVVQRQSLSRTSGLAVVEVAGRTLVLGTTEHQVSLLVELDDLAEEPAHEEFAAELSSALEDEATTGSAPAKKLRAVIPAPERPVPSPGHLAGSVLSPDTWRQAVAVVRGGR